MVGRVLKRTWSRRTFAARSLSIVLCCLGLFATQLAVLAHLSLSEHTLPHEQRASSGELRPIVRAGRGPLAALVPGAEHAHGPHPHPAGQVAVHPDGHPAHDHGPHPLEDHGTAEPLPPVPRALVGPPHAALAPGGWVPPREPLVLALLAASGAVRGRAPPPGLWPSRAPPSPA